LNAFTLSSTFRFFTSDADLLIRKTRLFLNDMYRSYLCVCFGPHVLCAAAVLTATMNLKIPLSLRHVKASVREAHFSNPDDSSGHPRAFPWKELFDVDYEGLSRLSEFTLLFIRLIKYADRD